MKMIPLTQGKRAIVDDGDYEYINKWKWFYAQGYACRTGVKVDNISHGIRIFMHHLIIPKTSGMDVDHINGDSLDNRRANLRLCTHQQNTKNKSLRYDSSTGYKGVSWHKQSEMYQAKICVNGKQIHLGLYDDPAVAAKVYDTAAKKYHGEFAKTNF